MAEAEIEFFDYRIQVKEAINDAIIAGLYEAGGEVASAAARNTRVSSGKTKNSWGYLVDENKLEVTIGNPLENAIWEEFGTGLYAINGDGRKNGWWIHVGYGQNEIPPEVAKKYGWGKISKDKDGNPIFVFTKGKKGTKAFGTAYEKLKKPIMNMFNKKMMEGVGG